MARYRQKDEFDLAWNKMRRALTMEVDRQFRDMRDEVLNDVLTEAFKKFTAAQGQGKTLAVKSAYRMIVQQAMKEIDIPNVGR